ncbi:MAG: Phosphatidylethanolamine N-methyltransferase [Myxococcaceae bacterium]|nr:Phosphatidylethanolamine N-methyltransferase [Myxococcaceae bacterium]
MNARLVGAAEFFETIAPRYDREYGLDGASTRARMQRILAALPSTARVLDLGVGTGRELPELLDAGHVVVGLDVSEKMLAICARRARPIELVRADLWRELPFLDASFDAVLALHGTLSHPPEDEPAGDAIARLAGEIARVLRPGGLWLTEVPSPGWLEAVRAGALPSVRLVDGAGDPRCLHEDGRAGVAVAATILAPARWQELLAPRFGVTVESISAVEQLVLALKPATVQASPK